jgi:alkanesulfonate monooxygenase SsuD/methylene tetrahydromethanopterin reductase-like flavin-dependent oxidoreductase (luciferase family)
MREGIEIIKRMWTEEQPKFSGEYFSIDSPYCEPKPIQKPHPPITIGGSGEKLTLKVVAEHANRSNWTGELKVVSRKLELLKEHCSQIGRNYDEIQKSWWGKVMLCEDKKVLRDRLKRVYVSGQLPKRTPSSFSEWFKKLRTEDLIGTPSECSTKIINYQERDISYFILVFLDSPSIHDMTVFADEVMSKM